MKHAPAFTTVRDEGMSPAQSPNTRLVASARAVGFDWGQDDPFMDAFETMADDSIKRTVTFVMNAEQKKEFLWATRDENGKLVAHEEEIDFDTFRERFINLKWIAENPDHPISYLRVTHRHHVKLLASIKKLPHHDVIRHGKRSGSIPSNASDEDRAKALKYLGRK